MTGNPKFAALIPLAAATALLFSAAGCSNDASDALEGRWVGDSVVNFSAQDVPMATGWALGTTFEFVGEQMRVQIPTEPARSGTFEVVELNGSELTVEVERADGLIDTARLRVEGEELSWLLGGDRELVMRRTATN